jgi:aminoglycoside phosphotransferase (APT) family kinase protein
VVIDERLDIEQPEALLAYLHASGRIAAGERPAIRPLSGGVSSRVVLVERAEPAKAWVLKQALPKLRVAVDWFSSPERVHREALALRWMPELTPPGSTPALVWEDRTRDLLAMTAVPQPHVNWKHALLRGEGIEHAAAFGRLLGRMHHRAWEQRAELAPVFADRSFFESLRIEPDYLYAASPTPDAEPFLRALVDDTRREVRTLVHGDYSPKNVLVHEGRLVLLDHEVAHFGDPAFDVGFSTTHLLAKANHLRAKTDAFTRAAAESWRAYAGEISPTDFAEALEARAVRHTLACLLARVDGRSPLEYLDEPARQRQRRMALALMQRPPRAMPALIDEWRERIGAADAGD